jgi:cobalt/nickel transport system permease protein
MKSYQKNLIALSIGVALVFAISPAVSAMHIMEGYLPPSYCIMWGVICLPFLIAGYLSIKKTRAKSRKKHGTARHGRCIRICAVFIKNPFRNGKLLSYDRNRLGAILFGPSAMSILGIIVLIFQAFCLRMRTDHAGSQYVFHGDCRSVRFVRHL